MPALPQTPHKRLCIFSDGTWASPDGEIPTNIVRLADAVTHTGKDGVPQMVFYDPGVGVTGSMLDRLRGGAFGTGIDLNIQELYSFLSTNYAAGDEILLFGYSRGAYTVRSLAGLIHQSGLVRRGHLKYVRDAYEMYRDAAIGSDHPDAVAFRAAHGDRVPLKLLCCFDTVGALGWPFDVPPPLARFFDHDRYKFHDTTLSPGVEHAVHALAIDEERKSFLPTVMRPHPARGPAQVTELFLPGFHGGVGGGSKTEPLLAANALRFAVDEIAKRKIGLTLDLSKMPQGYNIDVPPKKAEGWLSEYEVFKWALGQATRNIESVDRLHPVACRRYAKVESWRPGALRSFSNSILERALSLGRY